MTISETKTASDDRTTRVLDFVSEMPPGGVIKMAESYRGVDLYRAFDILHDRGCATHDWFPAWEEARIATERVALSSEHARVRESARNAGRVAGAAAAAFALGVRLDSSARKEMLAGWELVFLTKGGK